MSTDTTTPSPVASALAPHTPDSVEAAIRTHVALDAFADVVKDRRNAVRDWLDGRLDPGDSRKVPGLGTAGVTNPEPQVKILDRDAFAAWYAQRHPGLVKTRPVVNAARIAAVAEQDPTVLERLEELVPGSVEQQAFLPENIEDEVADVYARRDPDRPERLLPGVVADPESGEVIPGVEVRLLASPTLTVKPDKRGRAAYRAMIAPNGKDPR